MLKVEEQRHLCTLKLLQFFSTKQELGASNTDGTHGKQWLDRNKLKCLKALVFAKFSVESSEEKRKFGVLLKARLISNRLANYWLSRQINFITIFFLLWGQYHATSKAVQAMTYTLFTPPKHVLLNLFLLEWKS